MHYYQFNIADYANSTQHLEPMEDLAYRRMLDLYYSKEKPLPLDVSEIARLIRMRSHTECIAVVLQDFFIKSKDGYVNLTASESLSGIYTKSDKARAAANARWSKIKELQDSGSDADALQEQCSESANGMPPKTYNPLPSNPLPNVIDKSAPSVAVDFSVMQMSDDELSELKRIRKNANKGKAITQRVVNELAKQFMLAATMGHSYDDCLTEWETRSWKSFKAEWMPQPKANKGMSKLMQQNIQNTDGWGD